jgi:hypothetical protein
MCARAGARACVCERERERAEVMFVSVWVLLKSSELVAPIFIYDM